MEYSKKALILFYNDKNEVLLQDRSLIKKTFNFKWGFFGGGIENGETPEETVIRETKEELNFDLKDFMQIVTFKKVIAKGDILREVEAFIFVSHINTLENFNQLEGTGMEFFSVEEALKLEMSKGFDEYILEIFKNYILKKIITIYTTFPDLISAKDLVNRLLEKRFIACVNYSEIESNYHWKGEINSSNEIVALLKTRLENFEKIEYFIKENHPYETPCIIKNEVTANKDYVDWIYKETV